MFFSENRCPLFPGHAPRERLVLFFFEDPEVAAAWAVIDSPMPRNTGTRRFCSGVNEATSGCAAATNFFQGLSTGDFVVSNSIKQFENRVGLRCRMHFLRALF